MADYSASEMMTIAAARALKNADVCFVGIGLPSAACNLARLTHAPEIVLVYESGTLETRPQVLPLSIGDGELSDTALANVSIPEMFRYWLQGGRITVGFLSGAEVDRYGNINSTVIGNYDKPAVRLPGAGGAPEIATHCRNTFVIMRQSERSFVERLSFRTTLGHGNGPEDRAALGVSTNGPSLIVTDLCIMAPHPETKRFQVQSMHPGVTRSIVSEATGWSVEFADEVGETPPPEKVELNTLRELKSRTAAAHSVT